MSTKRSQSRRAPTSHESSARANTRKSATRRPGPSRSSTTARTRARRTTSRRSVRASSAKAERAASRAPNGTAVSRALAAILSDPDVMNDPVRSAKAAGLRYVTDSSPGITRKRAGKGFSYHAPDGKVVRDGETLARIRSLVIPPAWTDVWISPHPLGHVQATGHDARGRKQYRYHPRWRELRDKLKYGRMIVFAHTLPKIRERVQHDLALRGLPRAKVLAAVVRLLETTLIRVGNEEYAKSNGSFGLTTMLDDHVQIEGSKICFEFRGKSGKEHEIDLTDPRLARIVAQCQDLPGQELFQFLDDAGQVHDLKSEDVNEYLREITGHNFTAKDFRTWAGTVLAARALQEFEDFDSKAAAKRNIVRAIERVAERLGNTKAVCRKCYVHPGVIEAYMEKALLETLKQRTERELRERLPTLPPEEAAVLAILQQRMERELAKAPAASSGIEKAHAAKVARKATIQVRTTALRVSKPHSVARKRTVRAKK